MELLNLIQMIEDTRLQLLEELQNAETILWQQRLSQEDNQIPITFKGLIHHILTDTTTAIIIPKLSLGGDY